MRVRFSARTHVGMRREVNQDAYLTRALDPATLLVVCDGMGGHAAGEVASRLAVETIANELNLAHPPEVALRDVLTAANERVYSEGYGTMGTTGVIALLLNNLLHVANVGDSRAYFIREGQISQISQDHSFVSEQVAAGLMTPEQARASQIRNIITRALGHTETVEVDLFRVDLHAGDTVLLCSDGLHGLVSDVEIAETASMLPPEEAVSRLVDLANDRGGIDNITVVIAQVDELEALATTTPLATTQPLPPQTLPALTLPMQPIPPPAQPPRSAERPLSRLGLSLAGLTVLVLLGLGSYVMFFSGSSLGAPPPTPGLSLTTPPNPSATLAKASPTPDKPTTNTTASPARPTNSPPSPSPLIAASATPTRPEATSQPSSNSTVPSATSTSQTP